MNEIKENGASQQMFKMLRLFCIYYMTGDLQDTPYIGVSVATW